MIGRSRTNRFVLLEWWRSIDRVTLGLFVALLIVGLVLSMAASPAATFRLSKTYSFYEDKPFYFLNRHGFFVAVGLVSAIIVSMLPINNARRLGVLALVGGMVVLAVLPELGHSVKGSKRWIKIGPLLLQPSEFVKPGLVVFAAWMFSVRKTHPEFPGIIILFMVFGVLIFMLINQPDVGQSILLTLCLASVVFYAGLPMKLIGILFGASVVGGIIAFQFLSHMRDRIISFLYPENIETTQTGKALQTIANGGLFGVGPGEGSAKYNLTDPHTDFIFAVAVEEFGFLMSGGLILLLAAFVARCFRNAVHLNDYFSQLAVAGLATMIGLQTMINLAVNLNIAPATGMTLPFISYGGSSMLALSFSVGLILAFSRKRPGAYGYGID